MESEKQRSDGGYLPERLAENLTALGNDIGFFTDAFPIPDLPIPPTHPLRSNARSSGTSERRRPRCRR